ncbi:hypothetical protein HPB47_003469 [Ixodes persulcatus]|uniref:Uncharacterized protein n=1 Tax=Ixodes persulcatus TaxID=34615 RepID=A0AC60PJU8_IXOPE|nr:hypothetical protein HPB47_003469 [Ixodes persulcatus]
MAEFPQYRVCGQTNVDTKLQTVTAIYERRRQPDNRLAAHASLPGNEEAHDAARGLTVQAGTTSGAPGTSSGRDRLVTFRGILDHYTDGRRRFPPAHHSLNKRQSTVWRRLQTNTYPCPALLNRWYPDRYTGASEPRVQEDLVRLAEDAAGVQGILAAIRRSEARVFNALRCYENPRPRRSFRQFARQIGRFRRTCVSRVKARSHSCDLLNLGSLKLLKPEDTLAPSIG